MIYVIIRVFMYIITLICINKNINTHYINIYYIKELHYIYNLTNYSHSIIPYTLNTYYTYAYSMHI